MKSPLRYSSYELSLGGEKINGVLLEQGGAYSVLQPWTQLGDATLAQHLADLRNGGSFSLNQRALNLLEIERQAKAEKKPLRPGKLPPSHLQLDPEPSSLETLKREGERGIGTFKFKIWKSRDLDSFVEGLAMLLKEKSFRLRFDMNEQVTRDECFRIFSRIPEGLLNSIDFVEDPMRGNPQDWADFAESFNLRVACDFASPEFREVADVWILKPSRQDPWPLVHQAARSLKRIVVTSALDHPLGSVISAWEASRIFESSPLLMDSCGLLPISQDLSGAGWGMDSWFQKLTWEIL